MSWIRGLLPTCQETARLLSEMMDRSLPWHVRLRVMVHLSICRLCERYKRQLFLLRAVLRRQSPAELDDAPRNTPRLSEDAKRRIRQSLETFRQ